MFILLICSFSSSSLISGYYRISSIIISIDGNKPKGRNTTDLYIFADGKDIRIAGIHAGVHISKEFFIDEIVSDSLVVIDKENTDNRFRFEIRKNILSGEFSIRDEEGNSRTYHASAVIRKLNREEIEKLRILFPFFY